MSEPVVSEAESEIDRLMTLHPKGFDLSLDRISGLLELLGNPQRNLPPVIHIAGTNGKGSASAFAARCWRRVDMLSTSTPRRTLSTGTSATASDQRMARVASSTTPCLPMPSGGWRRPTAGRRSPSLKS